MSIKNVYGEIMTANELAKEMVLSYGQRAALAFSEGFFSEGMTDREKEAVEKAIIKQFKRIEKFLGHSGWTMD